MRTEDGQPVSTLQDYLHILRRRKWIIIPAILVAPLVAVYIGLREPVRYEASAQLLLSRQNLSASLANVSDPSQLDIARVMATNADLARVPEVAERTLEAAGMSGRSPSDFLGASRVSASQESDFMTFTVRSENPAIARRLATEYARQFNEYRSELDRDALVNTRASVRVRLEQLEAAGQTGSSLYADLAEKQDQLETAEALLTARGELVRPATGAGQIEPPLARIASIAFLLALVISVGLAFLRDALDPRIRSAESIGAQLGMRLLARLPKPPRRLRRDRRLAMLASPNSPYAERVRMLRTGIEFMRRGGWIQAPRDTASVAGARFTGTVGPRVMVTSALEQEGKSTTAANLAVAFAEAGRKTILVDLDFRRASLHRFFGLDRGPGIMDVVLGSVPLSDAISYVQADGTAPDGLPAHEIAASSATRLGVLPVGHVPRQVGGSLTSLAQIEIGDVLGDVEQQADLVVIDGPPLLRVGDAMELTSYVDSLLIVVSLDKVSAPMLRELARNLETCPAPKLGFVVTGAEVESGYEYLSYPYHQSRDLGSPSKVGTTGDP